MPQAIQWTDRNSFKRHCYLVETYSISFAHTETINTRSKVTQKFVKNCSRYVMECQKSLTLS